MWTFVEILTLFSILVFQRVHTAPCNSSTYGTEFYFGIMEAIDDCCHSGNNKVTVYITNVSPHTANVRVQIPYKGLDTPVIISPGNRNTIDVDPTIQKEGVFTSRRGIRVSSDYPVGVLVTNAFNSGNTIDNYNVLPVNSVGKDYLISSYHNKATSNRGSEIMVAGIYNNTIVDLYHGSRVIRSTTLEPFDVFQYRVSNEDLTGWRLQSTKDVFVTAGASFVYIPDRIPYHDRNFIASELYPINTWSKAFIVPPIYPRRLFRLLFMSDNVTTIDIRNGSKLFSVHSSKSEQEFGTLPVVITADRPITVSQFGTSSRYDNTDGNPFMAIVPSIDQYVNNLTFNVPDDVYGAKSYMTVIVPTDYVSGLRLDSRNLTSSNGAKSYHDVYAPFGNYTVISFPIRSGVHHVYHPVEDAKFCVFILGTGSELSSGFYPGFNLNGTCSKHEVTTSPPQTTVTSTYNTTQYWGNYTGGRYHCYSCEDMTHVELCDTIKQCGQQEVCFLEKYTKSGRNVFRSGCLAQKTCAHQPQVNAENCIECCHGNYCNNHGCGDSGLPVRPYRGPVCFDCQHVISPDECTTVSMCNPAQVCSIEEFQWGDHSHYKMGCAYELCDPLKRSITHRQDRSLPICHGCCEDDYCNRNCTIIKNGANVIVG